MREITSHRINEFNRSHVEVSALDGPGPGEASHHYRIDVWKGSRNSDNPEDMKLVADSVSAMPPVEMHFQNGPIAEAGPNGITDEALIAIVIDRMQGFQRGKYACRENALVVTKLEEAMHWLHHRTQQRQARNVEGTSAV